MVIVTLINQILEKLFRFIYLFIFPEGKPGLNVTEDFCWVCCLSKAAFACVSEEDFPNRSSEQPAGRHGRGVAHLSWCLLSHIPSHFTAVCSPEHPGSVGALEGKLSASCC